MPSTGQYLAVAYHLKILLRAGQEDGVVRADIRSAIDRDGEWTRFIEVRMAAGPTVTVRPMPGSEGDEAIVRWGSQTAHASTAALDDAIEVADRLANALYEIRRDGPRLL